MNMIKCALQISKGAAQRGRTEGAVLPVRCSAPEHNPYMNLKQHSTTARWIRLGVNFEFIVSGILHFETKVHQVQ